jgi:hypothetical protein
MFSAVALFRFSSFDGLLKIRRRGSRAQRLEACLRVREPVKMNYEALQVCALQNPVCFESGADAGRAASSQFRKP